MNKQFYRSPYDAPKPSTEMESVTESTHNYRITHHTPRVSDGGTDEWVHIHLKGPQGEFERLIDRSHPFNDREQGQTDEYIINGPEIRPIQQVGFRMVQDTNDDNYEWRCGWVKIEDLTTGYSIYIEDFGWINHFDRVFWKTPS